MEGNIVIKKKNSISAPHHKTIFSSKEAILTQGEQLYLALNGFYDIFLCIFILARQRNGG